MRRWVLLLFSFVFIFSGLASVTYAEQGKSKETQLNQRMGYYQKYQAVTLVPWYYLAAVDQYERNVQKVRRDIEERDGVIAIKFPTEYWVGTLNPNPKDTSPKSLSFFAGHGRDGNGDGKADQADDEDVLYTLSEYLARYGYTEDDFKIALWELYGRESTVRQIMAIAHVYEHYQTLELHKRSFPLPLYHQYSYRSTWGDGRGWGGRRIHEGTDIFTSYGVPVRSTTYGVLEVKGWNKFGGWRIGIRDINNIYHYYAHLSGYNDDLKEGDIVEPGTVVGYVGSSGYGKPGTSGKFPPHLHYGMYKYNGRTEWAFDPYPYLRVWEKKERKRKKR